MRSDRPPYPPCTPSLNQYHVIMEVAPKYWQTPETLRRVYLHSSNGQQVPLFSFARFLPANTPLSISHPGIFPAVTISFSLPAGVSPRTGRGCHQ